MPLAALFLFVISISLGSLQSQSLRTFQSESYGFSDTPFQSINSLALIDNFLYATGTLMANDISMNASSSTRGLNQVWGTRTERVAPWAWSYTYGASENSQISVAVKHSSLQIKQNIMILASKEVGLLVLPFWGLSPRETPDKNISSWRVPVTGIQSLTHLHSNGGVYGISPGGDLLWIPLFQPYTLIVPPAFGPTLPGSSIATSFPMNDTPLLTVTQGIQSSKTIDAVKTYPTATNTPHPAQYVTHRVGNFSQLVSVWLAHDTFTLYALTSQGGGSTLYSMQTSSGPEISLNSTPILSISQQASSFLVHPKTLDTFLLIPDSGIFVYNRNGALKGQVTTTMSRPRTLEMDNDGKTLWIGGDHEGKRAHLDRLDLEKFQLSSFVPLKSFSLLSLALFCVVLHSMLILG